MLAASKAKMSGNVKKENRNIYDFSNTKPVTRKFPEVSYVVIVQNNGKEIYQKVCWTCKIDILLIRPIAVFWPFSLPSPLNITRFYVAFE